MQNKWDMKQNQILPVLREGATENIEEDFHY